MYSHAIRAYRTTDHATAAPPDILLALYDGAGRCIAESRAAILRQDVPAKGRALGAAVAIIGELQSALDPRQAPELCGQLSGLYGYFTNRLQQAGLRQDVAILDEVGGHLKSLRDTWAQAIQQR